MKNIPVYQQHEDEYRLLLVELLLFLAMNDNQAIEYLNFLKPDGTLKENDVAFQLFTDGCRIQYKPLEIISFSANENNIRIFSLSLSDLLPYDTSFEKNSFRLKLKIGRLRSALGLLFWLSRRNPARLCKRSEKFIDSDLKWLRLYYRLQLGSPCGARQYAEKSLGLAIADSEIKWNAFDRDSFFESKLWIKARGLASEITTIINLADAMPDLDIVSLARQFAD